MAAQLDRFGVGIGGSSRPRTGPQLKAMARARQLGARVLVDTDDYVLGNRMLRKLTLNAIPVTAVTV